MVDMAQQIKLRDNPYRYRAVTDTTINSLDEFTLEGMAWDFENNMFSILDSESYYKTLERLCN